MIDFIQKNLRVIVVTLLAIGVILSVASSGTSDTTENTVTEETTQATDEAATTSENSIESEAESAENSQLETFETGYRVTAAPSDNQTVLMREVLDSYLNETGSSLSAVEKLYVETNAVNTLPRNDYIAVGQQFSIERETLDNLFAEAKALNDTQRAAWERYL